MPEESTRTIDKIVKFLCYRYAVIPNGQSSIWKNYEFSKRHVIDELVAYCEKTAPYVADHYGGQNVLIHIREIGETAHLFKFCRRLKLKRFEIDVEGSDVVQKDEDTYPFVYLIVDTASQVILMERKTTVFKNDGGAQAAFTSLVKQFLSDDNYYFSMDLITTSMSFWETVEAADEVFSVTLKLKSPNFLGSGYATTELLEKMHRISNNDYVDVKLTNSSGELELPREEFDDAIDYVTAGGGSWSTTTSSGGTRRVKHSSDEFAKIVEVRVSDQRPLDDGEIIVAIKEVGAKKEEVPIDVPDVLGS